ncbi:hypothetical protein TRICI_003565 [Trichomonascus ciferrii]|uniref:Uncharacterized protein n=1 Tax=Trichomonascus ciferrii TaxID=44093 RepID=A0A642V3E4_9ASCO|nr:hypothetical protein TRICI_003565 [Trichomonascus ciferrii]
MGLGEAEPQGSLHSKLWSQSLLSGVGVKMICMTSWLKWYEEYDRELGPFLATRITLIRSLSVLSGLLTEEYLVHEFQLVPSGSVPQIWGKCGVDELSYWFYLEMEYFISPKGA